MLPRRGVALVCLLAVIVAGFEHEVSETLAAGSTELFNSTDALNPSENSFELENKTLDLVGKTADLTEKASETEENTLNLGENAVDITEKALALEEKTLDLTERASGPEEKAVDENTLDLTERASGPEERTLHLGDSTLAPDERKSDPLVTPDVESVKEIVSGKAERAADEVSPTTQLPPDATTPRLEAPLRNGNASVGNLSVLIPIAPDLPTTPPAVMNDTESCPADNLLPCVAKCCPYGETLRDGECVTSNVRFIPQFTILVAGDADTPLPANATEVRQTYNLVANNICTNNRYRLEPFTESTDEFHLLFNGSLWLPRKKPHILFSDEYCMEVFDINGQEKMLPLVCFEEADTREASYHFIVYPVGLLISVPFLLATFLVYALIHELHTLPGKALACYVFCLTIAYIFLAVVQLGGTDLHDEVCIAVAFVIQFSFIASFFWLNVLCWDTWRNVFFHGDMAHRQPPAKERIYFIGYSLYAWSCTAVFIVVTMVMKFTPTIPSSYLKPSFGVKTCWFGTQKEAVPYFYAPIGCLILLNVILFLATAIKLCHQDRTTAKQGRSPKQTLQLCVTLFFMMGINWVMELVSWAAGGPNFIWYITDICNTLQGIFIFVIFVMNQRVRTLCHTRLLPRLRRLVPCCKEQFQPVETTSQAETINGRVNTYRFNAAPNENFA